MTEDLSSFFQLIAEEKKKQQEEINSLIGEDFFDENFLSNLVEAAKPKKKKHKEVLVEESQPVEEIKEDFNYVESYVSALKVLDKKEKLEETLTNPSTKEIQELKSLVWQLMRDVHLHGGGGEVNLAYMDMPLTSVTSSSYTVSLNDYYIGVNYAGAVSIILPTADREGKVFIVKDELGEASKGTNRYITIYPSGSDLIDGEDYVILAYDYGSLTFVWKGNSWRVV